MYYNQVRTYLQVLTGVYHLAPYATLKPVHRRQAKFKGLKRLTVERVGSYVLHVEKRKPFIQTLFRTYIDYSYLSTTMYFKPHSNFRLFYQAYTNRDLQVTNLSTQYTRWVNTYNLLFNLFYNRLLLLTFGPKTLKTELISLNWAAQTSDFQLFLATAPAFWLSDSVFGSDTTLAFERLKRLNPTSALVLDVGVHKKSLYYLKSQSIFTIGLIPVNQNPWEVSYPIPALSTNLFVQYYFIKLLIFIKQTAESAYYKQMRSLWK